MTFLSQLIPHPPAITPKSRIYDLKSRLDWGEPALTLIDVRKRDDFNINHIMGAISMPSQELVFRAAKSLPPDRDIYIYGETDEVTAEAAAKLRNAGFRNVSELRGGLAAWKAVGFPIEGNPAIIA